MNLPPFADFYTTPGPMTEPGPYGALLDSLPTSLPELVRAVQGLAVHIFWAKRYGLDLSEERQAEVGLRPLRKKLARILEMDTAPLTRARPPEHRLVSNCRDFSVMLAGMLIRQGVPARARCGFGTYFMVDHYEDHWVVEYWNAGEARWVRCDPQIDDLMRETLGMQFDPLDMGRGSPDEPGSNWFVPGGEAWLMCRYGGGDPEQFGIFDMHGWDFIRGNLYRDLLALNKIEILPWDYWPGMGPDCVEFNEGDWELHDHLAELTCDPEAHFEEIRGIYESEPELRIPAEWTV